MSCALPGSPMWIRSSLSLIGLSVLRRMRRAGRGLEREHAIERQPRVALHRVGYANGVHDVALGQVLERPQQVRGIDAVHGRARADVLLQRADLLLGMLEREP